MFLLPISKAPKLANPYNRHGTSALVAVHIIDTYANYPWPFILTFCQYVDDIDRMIASNVHDNRHLAHRASLFFAGQSTKCQDNTQEQTLFALFPLYSDFDCVIFGQREVNTRQREKRWHEKRLD
jgi:hypothetical protein